MSLEGKDDPQPMRPPDKEELSDLSEVYRLLKQDAKDMLFDLLEGVSLWRSNARMMFFFSGLSFFLALVFVWGTAASYSPGSVAPFPLAVIAIFLFGLGVATVFSGFRYRRKYRNLREKYSELYEAANKLG
jgi:hypothetical protein